MTATILKSTLASLVLALLSACGGADPAVETSPKQAAATTHAAATSRSQTASCDSPDCAPVIDGLAEEFRSRAQRKPAPGSEAAPAYPQVAADAVIAPPAPAPEGFGTEGS